MGLGTSRLRSWKRTHLLLHAIPMLLFPTPHQISKSVHQHYPNPQPLKTAHLATTEVTLQETLWVAQNSARGRNCKPGASMSAPPPPPREDKRPSWESTKTISCICNSSITPCTYGLIIFPCPPFLPPSPPHLELTEKPLQLQKKVTVHVWYHLKCLSAPGKMVSFSQS